ncbi:homeobox domain protein [Necator americanus]|uniref:Homeobox domain protein n=1 Tax=Necator americanus TaxID=51031 RepID=W2TN88_NECAM|nr:homeobox domain protein [Necator americanus]ETN83134.1 homeobox domain protein [Necator americanus]
MNSEFEFSEAKPPLSAMGHVVESIGIDNDSQTGMVFHVDCHACIRCGRRLSPGEQILVDEAAQSVACMQHFYTEQQRPTTFPSCSTEPSGYETEQFSEFQIKKEVDTFGYGFDSYSFSDFCDEDNKFLKRRGPRTTIKQNQLDVLNRIFSSTPKPSKHARAKLALETGLSMRVIQVWFQNRRSKERRLKHLCNYLRHYEQRGLLPPPVQFAAGEGGRTPEVTSFSQYLSGIEGQLDEDDEED